MPKFRTMRIETPAVATHLNGRDELPIPVKVGFDEEYLRRRSHWFDLKIILLTVWKVVAGAGVKH